MGVLRWDDYGTWCDHGHVRGRLWGRIRQRGEREPRRVLRALRARYAAARAEQALGLAWIAAGRPQTGPLADELRAATERAWDADDAYRAVAS